MGCLILLVGIYLLCSSESGVQVVGLLFVLAGLFGDFDGDD